ncbi:AAA family ATPase [Halomonas sp.]|uniref:AAA family ATPase n=1 Tax=Halomonas sp. TaxID=1486246 RepID=UPI00356960B2
MTDLSHHDITLNGNELNITENTLRGLAGYLKNEGDDMSGFAEPHELTDIADKIHRQRIKSYPVIAFCGLPGSGKTTIGEFAAELGHAEFISMGDAIRHEAPENIAEDSEELGEFAARTREDDPRAIPNWTIDRAVARAEEDALIIDGVRSVDDYMVLNNFFESFVLINVRSDFYNRLERLQEGEFEAGDLLARDERENQELGLAELLTYEDAEFLPDDIDYPEGLHDGVMVNDGEDLSLLYEKTSGLLNRLGDWAPRLDENDEEDIEDEEIEMGEIEP